MMDFDKATRLVQRGIIEVAPLAFMRGRTLNDSFVILDEAQNTTSEQMMMFLTRLGFGVQGGDHRGCDPDRSAPTAPPPGWWKRGSCCSGSRASPSSISANGTWCAIPWCRISSGPMRPGAEAGCPRGGCAAMTDKEPGSILISPA